MIKNSHISDLISKASATLCLVSVVAFSACSDKDDFTTDSGYKLRYSTDTLAFEPLITEQTTSTRAIMVYNKSGKDIRVDNIALESPDNNFQINVDGRNGNSFDNIEIRDNDSLFIYVRAQPAEAADHNSVIINDKIVFTYNDNREEIVLNAVAQNAMIVRGLTISNDTTWTNEQPILVFDSLKVANGATLTIKQGTEILFHNGAIFQVDGKIDVRGNASNPVLMSGDRYDKLTSSIPYTRLADQWQGIHITESSYGNIIEGAYIISTTFGIKIDSTATQSDEYKLMMNACMLRTASEGVLTSYGANIYISNSVLANGGYRNVWIEGGDCIFNHCTITCYSSTRMYGSLCLGSNYGNPLTRADVNNCIIYGSVRQELNLGNEEGQADTTSGFKYRLKNCLLADVYYTKDTTNFVDCVRNKAASYTRINGDYLYYDFHISENSAAIGIGSPDVIMQYQECMFDLDGNPRLNSIDAGAYAFISE